MKYCLSVNNYKCGNGAKFWGYVTSLTYIKLFELPFVGALISLWLFLAPIFIFAAQPKEIFLDGLKKLEQRSHKCVELRGEYVE
jgi:hypothetical protein